MRPAFRGLPALDVSRETLDRLDRYETLLRKWNPAINLVSRATLDDAWRRHFLDSAQLLGVAPDVGNEWADIGSGGGFPGLVVAILAQELRPGLRMTLVESDLRKSAFLVEAARATGADVTVLAERAETLEPLGADILTARAFAPLGALLALAVRHLKPGGTGLFLKGARADDEIAAALESFRFTLQKFSSRTDPKAVILSVGDIERV